MREVKLIKIKEKLLLPIPETFAKLYFFESGQSFNLEIKEKNGNHKLIFLTYITNIK